MNGEICDYCGQDPCDCPVFDLPEDPDNPIDDDADDIPEKQVW
jgi:hypothetical protein